MQLQKNLLAPGQMKPKPANENNLGFGRIFSDHMFRWDYKAGQGWHSPRVEPYGPIVLDPAALILHYGKEVFESLKAYCGAQGGTGEAKTSDNYTCSLLAAEEAHAKGYTQVLWLDACDRKTIEEVSTSNIFFVIGDKVITAPLGGTILPGVTRDSVIQLCRHWGLKVNERRLTIDEVIAASKPGALKEAFGTGTAAVVSPVGAIAYQGQELQVAGGATDDLTKKLYDEIIGIQLGTRPDSFGWVFKVA